MSKSLITLASWLFALLSAVAILWRGSVHAGFLALAFPGPTAASRARPAHALCLLIPTPIFGRGLRAPGVHVSARGLWPQAEHLRSRVPRTCSTTAFGLFDATRERGMGHPAG
jgi:hypothetical protein